MIKSFEELIKIAQKLRGPGGCPWDKSRSLYDWKDDLVEEAEEVAQAIENEDDENLREELGDLLFNIIMMGVIAEQEGKFTLKEVFEDIAEKIVGRHTWVFADDEAATPEEVLAIWAKNKEKEARAKRAKKSKKANKNPEK